MRHQASRNPFTATRAVRRHLPTSILDVALAEVAFGLALLVRFGGQVPARYSGSALIESASLVALAFLVAGAIFGTYRPVWRFASLRDLLVQLLAAGTAVAALGMLEVAIPPLRDDRPLPLSVILIGGCFAYLGLSHTRLLPHLRNATRRRPRGRRLVIVGAGEAGRLLARQLRNEPGPLRPLAFIDDDLDKIGRHIGGLPVVGGRDRLRDALKKHEADTVAIAIPSASRATVRELTEVAERQRARVLIVPRLHEMLATGQGLTLREVGLEDLLGRDEVAVDAGVIMERIHGRRVLVTGAAGSIGSEICRQMAAMKPAELVLVDIDESGLADLRSELRPELEARLSVTDVRDPQAVLRLMSVARPEIVVHAAAYKHVDILEDQPELAVMTNVGGTWNCVRAAEHAGVGLFVFISSDKAVDPTGVLGASKRIGELMVTSLANARTIFCAVRFGNVLGSRGSVVPLFERQIAAGGPLTVTHPDVRRYFMSISEAVRLVLQSAAMARPGSVYVLDMGEDVPITQIAERLARLRGLRVPEDIRIEVTGLRAGERLREALVGDNETMTHTPHPKVWELTPAAPDFLNGLGDWGTAVDELATGARKLGAEAVRKRLITLAIDGPPSAQLVAS